MAVILAIKSHDPGTVTSLGFVSRFLVHGPKESDGSRIFGGCVAQSVPPQFPAGKYRA